MIFFNKALSVKRVVFWIIILLSGLQFSANAQPGSFSFDHLNVEGGLSQSTVFAITQDSKGYIWIGTRDGLNRYDSHEIRTYRNISGDASSLSYNVVNALLHDSKGQLWVGTYHGLCVYHPETDNFSQIKSLSNDNINAVFEDRDKNIWVGTRKGLNLIVNQNPLQVIQFFHDPQNPESIADNQIRTIYQDKAGSIWIGTINGLSRLKHKRNHEYQIVNYTMSGGKSLNDNWINVIEEGNGETLWIGTEKGGLNIFDQRENVFYSRSNRGTNPGLQEIFNRTDKAVRVIRKDKNGQYWIGSLGGLFIFDPTSRQLRTVASNPDDPTSLSDNSIRAIFIDRDGSYWIGTYYGGVNFYSPMSKQFDHFKQTGKNAPLRYKIASALYEDFQNDLWLGIEGEGLIHWNRKNNTYETFSHKADDPASISHDNVKSICPDGKEGLWIGTFNGLNYFSLRTRKFTRYRAQAGNPTTIPDDRVYDIKPDKQGNFWFATNGGGLCKYDKNTKLFKVFKHNDKDANSLTADFLTCLQFDSKGRLWIGASESLNMMLPNGNIVHLSGLSQRKSLIDGRFILFIYEDRARRIWVGTRGSGLFLYNEKTADFKNYSVSDGLPGNNIFGMLEDGRGFLWLSTENGLSKFDPAKNKFQNFTKSDGLVCKEFNYNSYLKDHSGTMYFGGYDGIVIFHPDNIRTNTSVPMLMFTKLKLFNNEVRAGGQDRLLEQSIGYTNNLTFKHNQNVFTIEFALLNYINPGKNRYEYKLEGFEKDWNITAKPEVTYMNLAPGDYTLWVKACNNDGIWNKNPIAITITILPPPWKTWWAYMIYTLLLVLLFWIFVRFSHVRLRLEQELYLEQIENKKQNELHQSKLRFFTNISHELRTPLTLIISPLENLIETWEGDLEIKKKLQSINNNASRLLRLINQLLDFRKQESGNLKLKVAEGNLVKFIGEIVLSFKEYASVRGIALEFSPSQTEIKGWYDRAELEKVFLNLISNAFKFVPEKDGKVQVAILVENKWITVVVEDNGQGIPYENIDRIFDRFYQVENSGMEDFGFGIGLSLSKGIVEMHHGRIDVESSLAEQNKPGRTAFFVRIPLGKEHFAEDEISKDFKTSEQVESYIEMDMPVEYTSVPPTSNSHSSPDSRTLLIVDDNFEIRAFLAERLKKSYTVLEAENGEHAWEIAIESVPDLIISDVVMPKLDGIALTNRLKGDVRTSHIPVILLTARNAMAHQLEGLETGADEYLTKPFNISVLALKVRNILKSYEILRAKYSRIVTLEPSNTEISGPEEKFLQRLMSIIEKHMADTEFNVSKLVDEIGMSRPVLFRKLKALTDMSMIDLIKTTRLKKAAALLKQKTMTISEVSYAVGFTDSKYFSKAFRQQYGKSPSEYISEEEG
ncbi:MAG: two-component regulator propeller domain-containing protein [Bacteroidota bacterium]|nr:two-component regulator propeller domain-containing protein [Bacteroidota bacterium]